MDDKQLRDSSGKRAVELSRDLEELRRSDSLEKGQSVAPERLRKVGAKTFVLDQEGFWIDTEIRDDAEARARAVVITYLSDAYFALVNSKPALGRIFKIGAKLLVEHEGTIYRVE
jgi:hypothetical protein